MGGEAEEAGKEMKENLGNLAVGILYTRITAALGVAIEYGQIDGAHHKQWVINEMVRKLLGDNATSYEELVTACKADTYGWEEGIPP